MHNKNWNTLHTLYSSLLSGANWFACLAWGLNKADGMLDCISSNSIDFSLSLSHGWLEMAAFFLIQTCWLQLPVPSKALRQVFIFYFFWKFICILVCLVVFPIEEGVIFFCHYFSNRSSCGLCSKLWKQNANFQLPYPQMSSSQPSPWWKGWDVVTSTLH